MKVHLSEGRRRHPLFHANDSTDPAEFQHHHDLIVEKDERRTWAAQSSKRYPPSRRGPTAAHAETSRYEKRTSSFPRNSGRITAARSMAINRLHVLNMRRSATPISEPSDQFVSGCSKAKCCLVGADGGDQGYGVPLEGWNLKLEA